MQSLTIQTRPSMTQMSPNLSSVELEPSYLEQMLLHGTTLLKVPKSAGSKPKERLVHVEYYPLSLVYASKTKKKSIDFVDIVEIRMGQNTEGFKENRIPEMEERAFSIIYLDQKKYRELNWIAPTVEKCVQWVMGLHILHTETATTVHDLVGLPDWLHAMWNSVDDQGTGSLDLDHVSSLLYKLNIEFSKSEMKSAVKDFKIANRMTFEQFERMYRNIKFRPEVAELFCSVAKSELTRIVYPEFVNFVNETQKEEWDTARLEETFARFSCDQQMDLDHFTAFLMSSKNRFFAKQYQSVHQDMDRPLNEYFVSSSHNTYA
jgi:phosphatidylinositol phospholipase C delta